MATKSLLPWATRMPQLFVDVVISCIRLQLVQKMAVGRASVLWCVVDIGLVTVVLRRMMATEHMLVFFTDKVSRVPSNVAYTFKS